jgi:glucosamine--fructose-6-phosphate aminotransferase (isomerizing)
MAVEIGEQPQTLADTLEAAFEVAPELTAVARDTDRVLLLARGSSANAATYGRYLLEIAAGVPAALGAPSVASLYAARLDLDRTLVVMLSQSGRTAELVEAAAWARTCGARTVAVTSDEASPLAAGVDVVLPVAVGAERAVPATKTYTGQLMALAVLAGAVRTGARAPSRAMLAATPDACARLLRPDPAVEEVAQLLATARSVVVAGRGPALSVAEELALKLLEAARLPALAMSAAELQHGPLAVLGPGVPLIVVGSSDGPTMPGLVAVAEIAVGRESPVVCLGGGHALRSLAAAVLPGPELPELVAPIVQVVPGQVAVELLARLLGLDADRPAGLSKVTQTA